MSRALQCLFVILISLFSNPLFSATDIPANHPYIQYFGRWNFSDPLAPSHSWPGVYIYAEFEGTSIGVRIADNFIYYNVFIDGVLTKILKGTKSVVSSYTVASGLADGEHTILFTKRCETTWTEFSFHGFVLDDGKNLLPPAERPQRKIEFIGDSFTSASGNEYTQAGPATDAALYTNIYEGFASIVARHYEAQYMCSSISGFGMVLDWTGDYAKNIPDMFDRTHLYTALPKWDFEQWIPNLVVIGLGLNDYSGFGGWSGHVADEETNLYKEKYHEFISVIRDVYPGVKILAVAAHVEWMQQTIAEVVAEENAEGRQDVFYAFYHYYAGGYVNDGHPNVETHHYIADELIAAIDSLNAWEPFNDKLPPVFTQLPASPFTVYATSYTLKVETDTYATVRYSMEDKPYDEMGNEFTVTGKRKHSVTLPCEPDANYTYYLRAIDVNGNMSDASTIVSFDVDLTKKIVTWYDPQFDETGWQENAAPFGFGAQNTTTEISPVQTVYLRRTFQLENVESITRFTVVLQYDNGAVIYVNGREIGRVNMPEDDITYNSGALINDDGNRSISLRGDDLHLLQNGANLIAIEIHQSSVDLEDLFFDAMLRATQTYVDYGSTWKYYDAGNEPQHQLVASGIAAHDKAHPEKFHLMQNFPNPFNPRTSIAFTLTKKGYSTLEIFNVLGEKVAVLNDGNLNQGSYRVEFDGSNLPSGEYFYRLRSHDFLETKKLLLMK